MKTLTDKQAYVAMFHFLDKMYKLNPAWELGGLLGSMSMLKDGFTADPAMADYWQQAIEYALTGGEPGLLTIS